MSTNQLILIEAQNIEDRELMRQKWAGLFVYATKHIRASNLLAHTRNILQMMQEIDDPDGIEYITAIVNYTLSAGEFSNSEEYF
jgi:hypothetical protein